MPPIRRGFEDAEVSLAEAAAYDDVGIATLQRLPGEDIELATQQPAMLETLRVSVTSDQIGQGQADIAGVPMLVVPRHSQRIRVTIANNGDPAVPDPTIAIGGGPSVGATNGYLIEAGERLTIDTRAALYAVSVGAAVTVSWLTELEA